MKNNKLIDILDPSPPFLAITPRGAPIIINIIHANGMENFGYWWIGSFPGLAIFSISIAANFLGDGLRDYLDPRLRKSF